MEELVLKLKKEIIEVLNLEEVKPEDIDNDAPLFGDGLGLDSIDALELIVLIEKNYGIKLKDPAKGKEICAIVKLKTRLNGHKATITEDYQRLKGIVMEKRSEEKLDKWIKDKQKHTYVRINEKWQKCDFKYPGWVKK